jgi:hypothetical protein
LKQSGFLHKSAWTSYFKLPSRAGVMNTGHPAFFC